MKYAFTVLTTLFVVWFFVETWRHFPADAFAFGAFLILPIVATYLAAFCSD